MANNIALAKTFVPMLDEVYKTAALTAFLKEKLPRYMLPNKMERLERMPLTPNGKVDRVKLKDAYFHETGR